MNQILIFISVFTLMVSCKNNSKVSDGNTTEYDSLVMIAKAKAIHQRVITLDTHCDINVKTLLILSIIPNKPIHK